MAADPRRRPRRDAKWVLSRSAGRLESSGAAPVRLDGSENGLQAADGPLPVQRTHDDVRGTTQKSVVPRSARRLASCEATPAVFGGSQNGWRPTDGPLSWPPKRPLRDLRVVPTCASSTAYACDVASPKLVQDGRLG